MVETLNNEYFMAEPGESVVDKEKSLKPGNLELLQTNLEKWEKVLFQNPEGSRARKARQAMASLKGEIERLQSGYVGRKIPENTSREVQERDVGKNFNRPGHICKKPGPPHHIVHYSEANNGKGTVYPHDSSNLEAPCEDCHKLAHVLNIPSGSSVADFFARIPAENWRNIEQMWRKKNIAELKKYISLAKF